MCTIAWSKFVRLADKKETAHVFNKKVNSCSTKYRMKTETELTNISALSLLLDGPLSFLGVAIGSENLSQIVLLSALLLSVGRQQNMQRDTAT